MLRPSKRVFCSKITTTVNITADGPKSSSFVHLFCSPAELTGVLVELIFLITLNIVLSITTILGNTLILIALQKESSLYPPIKLLFRCLATTDLLAGLIAEPLFVVNLTFVLNERWTSCRYTSMASFLVGYILASVSLLTVTAISVDRLLALLLGPRYRHFVTWRRTCVTATLLWVVAIVGTAMFFWNHRITLWYGYIGISLCLFTSVASYSKIFLALRHHQNHVQSHVPRDRPNQTGTLNIARFKKAVSSAVWVQLTLVVCYLPYVIADALIADKKSSSFAYVVKESTVTLVFLSSSLNPILYCWKIKEVRQAVKDTIRQLYSF